MTSSEAIDLKYRNGIATLRIGEIFPEDEGEYVCTATNSLGSVETHCKLTVKRKHRMESFFLHLSLFIKFIFILK